MQYSASALFFLALVAPILSAAVSGSPEGFASGTTGGAGGSTVTPSTTDELVSYLESNEALTIVLTKTFDFTGTEGSTTENGCAPWGTGSGCQLAINKDNWCANYQSGAGSVSVTYDKAASTPINVGSDKTLIGEGSAGVIKGKGLSLSGGVSNVIIQNVAITELNPEYVWGGDAITLNGCSNVWIDHVTTSLIGRMHIVAGYETNTAVTISNCEINGETSWSASCDGHHYWALYFTGTNDQITFKGNYIHHTSGRSPKVDKGTLIHMVNNYWDENSGHAFEGENAYVLLEGSTFDNVQACTADYTASTFAPSSVSSSCSSGLGRSCAANSFVNSGAAVSGSDSSVLSKMKGLKIADADADASGVPSSAGVGKVSSSRNATRRAVSSRFFRV
ncbi:related to Probable pectin lyase B [Ramularia collo-cygni]|uniref:pectin lyase n=1 Tax=Ramularia collo-cygni TaxID=112498 RepID=A0A2D3VPC8_9PEZI|nr:related to Probable pectin lyase B [Ramularia collo-cygni]CZT24934.1 related to Probable pectin lyase B [Ramularia collo-cygni]